MPNSFEELQSQMKSGGPKAVFARLADEMRAEKKYHELFDARLMEARHKLGLPVILTSSLDDLPEPQRTQVENAYLEACREVGKLLLAERRVREAWMYLRPAGEKPAMAAALADISADEDSIQEFIEVALHEGVAPRLGFQQVLKHYGTCNAITMFDQAMHNQPRPARQDVAGLLVRHLHGELVRSLQADITRQEGSPPSETTIHDLVADRDWLFLNDNYHIDTSHLQAVTRFARLVEDPQVLRLAVDLTEYGRRLSRQFQYPGDEPFADAHPAQAMFFRAQLGEQVEEGLAFFRERAEALPAAEHGSLPAEVYVALLARLGRHGEALDALLRLVPPGVQTSGFAPTMMELARLSGDYDRLMQACQERNDLLSYTAGLVERSASKA